MISNEEPRGLRSNRFSIQRKLFSSICSIFVFRRRARNVLHRQWKSSSVPDFSRPIRFGSSFNSNFLLGNDRMSNQIESNRKQKRNETLRFFRVKFNEENRFSVDRSNSKFAFSNQQFDARRFFPEFNSSSRNFSFFSRQKKTRNFFL